jgi:hypothetical protein
MGQFHGMKRRVPAGLSVIATHLGLSIREPIIRPAR